MLCRFLEQPPQPRARAALWLLQLVGDLPVHFGVFLSEVEAFDAGALGVSTPEAAMMDPQQRLLLRTAAEALQSVDNHTSVDVSMPQNHTTGVYVGVSSMDYNKVCWHFSSTMFAATQEQPLELTI